MMPCITYRTYMSAGKMITSLSLLEFCEVSRSPLQMFDLGSLDLLTKDTRATTTTIYYKIIPHPILCLEGSVISFISPPSEGSSGPI